MSYALSTCVISDKLLSVMNIKQGAWSGTPGFVLSHLWVLLLCVAVMTLWSLMQVPRSSKKLSEDNEYALYTVTLFRKVADTFKTSAREKGFQVGSKLCCRVKHICFFNHLGFMTQIWQLIFSDSCGDLWNQVRDFEFDPEGQMQRSEELDRLQHDQEILQSTLLQWCYASYGEVPISI